MLGVWVSGTLAIQLLLNRLSSNIGRLNAVLMVLKVPEIAPNHSHEVIRVMSSALRVELASTAMPA
jgi:hypothetical protein